MKSVLKIRCQLFSPTPFCMVGWVEGDEGKPAQKAIQESPQPNIPGTIEHLFKPGYIGIKEPKISCIRSKNPLSAIQVETTPEYFHPGL